MRKLGLVLALIIAACGDDAPTVNHVADPQILPKGGIGAGAIQGELNVFVVDSLTSAPIAGATVQVEAATPLVGNTDSSGLVVFTDSGLSGAQTVTAQATDYANATWIGANGAVLTIPLESNDPTPVTPTSHTVAVTIEGFSDITVAAGHAVLGIILYSLTPDFDDPANEIEQGTRTILGTQVIPANACVKMGAVSDCNAALTTRAGAQALWGVVLDVENLGQPEQTMTLIGYALLRGLDVNADIATVQTLALLTENTEIDQLVVTWGTPPTGLNEQKGIPILDLGDEGWIIAAFPSGLTNDLTEMTVPALAGPLAVDADYDIIAMSDPDQADGATDIEFPQSVLYRRGVDISAAVALDNWMGPPSGITAVAGTYSFTPAAGATIHMADFYGVDGEKYWSVGIFDGSTEFALPEVTPGLPVGTVSLSVGAMEIPGASLTDFNLDEVMDLVTRMANNQTNFSN